MSASMTFKLQQQSQGLLSSSSMKIEEEETMLTQKQGIVTILGCDSEKLTPSSASSLRRTLSADMSSKKWVSQNQPFSTMKKIASSEKLLQHTKTISHSFSSSEGEDDYEETKEFDADADADAERERLEIWSSIQRNKKEEQEKAGPFDTWSSIISIKAKDEISKSVPVTPYIHPLVKRSKSSLSEKSLEICTESLGSETGSEGLFSSYSSSETGDADEEEQEEKEQQQEQEELFQVPRYNYAAATTKKSSSSSPRSFPPPLPSLSHQTGPSLHMRPRRDSGRLVLEAVSLPSLNNFCVQRQDGRLVLTFASHKENDAQKENGRVDELEEDFEQEDDDIDQEDMDEDEIEDSETEEEEEVGEFEKDASDVVVESVIEKAPLLSSGISSSVHRLGLMMNNNNNKPIGLANKNPKWSEKFNQVTNFEDISVVEASHQMTQSSLPPRPRVARLIPSAQASAAAASFNFNAYEHYWRTKTTAKDAKNNPLVHHQQNNNNNSPSKNNNSSNKLIVSGDMNKVSNEEQQLLVLRGKNGGYLIQNVKSCKESRRSFLFWEPYCIATS